MYFFSESATNQYLDADGMLNLSAVSKLATQAAKEAAALGDTAKLKIAYFTGKELPKYSASLEKKGDFKYKTLRAQQVKTRATKASVAKIDSKRLLIVVYEGFSKQLNADIRKLESAINQHNKKAEKQVAQVKDAKATIRAEQEKEFASNIEEVKGLLIQSGVKEANFFTGRSLFGGAVVFVKLPNGGVITINKSSAELLRKAKLAAKKAE